MICLPSLATSFMGTPFRAAMYPNTENTTNPARNEVKQLMPEVTKASLENKRVEE